MARRVVVAVPARNEADRIGGCLGALTSLRTDPRVASLEVVVMANNCDDDTAAIAGAFGPACKAIALHLPLEHAHAGWARRMALDAAANRLRDDGDVLMSTDADSRVDPDWLVHTLDHLDSNWDAVAGLARLAPAELRRLDPRHRRRLASIQRHEATLDRLRAATEDSEPWPRHFYEGGASIALTLHAYRRTGGAPTPPVAEDKALFDAVRRSGGRVRHAKDVRVWTSARLVGRAPGGASDTLALWGRQDDAEPIWGVATHDGEPVSFADLPAATARARALAATVKLSHGATYRADRRRLVG